MYKFSLVFFGLCLCLFSCQSKHYSTNPPISKAPQLNSDSAKAFPLWIDMMNNPRSNYYDAVAAFDLYWQNREKPAEESGEGKDIYGKEKSEEEKEKDAKKSIQYVYEYKQFLNWKERNKNLVKPDGTIMTAEEILEQSENERKNR